MTELWLKFKDASGGEKRVEVSSMKFIVGRHSASDLPINDGRLSREHLLIERIGDEFYASDLGSSNGTSLNGEPLTKPAKLKNGDALLLGGGVGIKIQLPSDQADQASAGPEFDPESADPAAPDVPVSAPPTISPAAPSPAAKPAAGGFPTMIFIIAPILGIILLVFAGGLIYLLSGSKQTVIAENDDFQYSVEGDSDDDTPGRKGDDPDTKPSPGPSVTANTPGNDPNRPVSSSPEAGPPSGGQPTSETAKAEQNGAAFLRRIAQNDPKAFLTGDQAKRVGSKIKQLSGSSALADNINSARKNAAQIKSLAASKNLKPQFLAVAAITKLGSSRGDALQAATAVADIYDKLGTQIGNELAEDALLMVAAYDQGSAGEFLKMRNMLQDLANRSPESARAIRSIWFLEKNGKITSAEFERSLSFLAIGTITQNPKDFGVNAEALTL